MLSSTSALLVEASRRVRLGMAVSIWVMKAMASV